MAANLQSKGRRTEADRSRNRGQAHEILQRLRSCGARGCTNVELWTIGHAVNSRISDLRTKAHVITCTRERVGVYRYVLIENPPSKPQTSTPERPAPSAPLPVQACLPLDGLDCVVPKRVLDGDAMWTSRKLKLVEPEWARGEFANLLPLAFANGVFELDVDQIHARVYAYLRPTISREDVTTALTAFERVGLLFRWHDENGKAWGYWIGIDKPGRLPGASRKKDRHERLGPDPPRDQIEEYLRGVASQWSATGQPPASLGFGFGFGLGSGSGKESCASHTPSRPAAAVCAPGPQPSELQPEGEQTAQPQPESQRRETALAVPQPAEPTKEGQEKPEQLELGQSREEKPRVLLEIYEQEHGRLPAVRETPERLSKCRTRLLSHTKSQEQFLADFRAAVRKAGQIAWPAWRPSFDWFTSNDTNYAKVLEGNYDGWNGVDHSNQRPSGAVPKPTGKQYGAPTVFRTSVS